MSVTPGAYTFPILQKTGVSIVTVTEEQVKAAVWWLLTEMKLLVEPGGAVAVAAWMNGLMDDPQLDASEAADVVLVLSGGNVDPSMVTGWNT